MLMFCIYDSKAEYYRSPVTLRSQAEAMRSVGFLPLEKDTDFGKFPGDFYLYEVGRFDEQTAEIVPHEVKIPLGSVAVIHESVMREINRQARNLEFEIGEANGQDGE